MTFNAEEKFQIENIFGAENSPKTLESFLPEDIYAFLQKREFLRTISDKIIWRNANRYRPFSSCIITKFLHEKIDIFNLLEKLLINVEFEYLLFLDFHFLVTCPSHDSEESDLVDEIDDSNRVYKFQRGSKASAFNTNIKFSSQKDTKSLLKSIEGFGPSDFLKTAFKNHTDLFNFHGSDLRPYMLLSIVVHLQKIN